jgi:hypothetical protein
MRPEKIYLEEPITINDVEVRHTKEGLIYLIDHYESILNNSTPKQLGEKERQHIKEWLLPNLQYHVKLYETKSQSK